MNPVIRNILGQVKAKVSIPFMMDHGRIFIANLSKGQLGHDKANLLGSLLTTQFQLAAMARANRPEQERRDFHLVIDEFQNFFHRCLCLYSGGGPQIPIGSNALKSIH